VSLVAAHVGAVAAGVVAELVVGAVDGAGGGIEGGDGGGEQLDVVDLEGLVGLVGDLALERDAGAAEGGVEAAAVELDVLGVFEEIAAGGGGVEEGDLLGAGDGGLDGGGAQSGELGGVERGGVGLREDDELPESGRLGWRRRIGSDRSTSTRRWSGAWRLVFTGPVGVIAPMRGARLW
jgi:hypothetical protein